MVLSHADDERVVIVHQHLLHECSEVLSRTIHGQAYLGPPHEAWNNKKHTASGRGSWCGMPGLKISLCGPRDFSLLLQTEQLDSWQVHEKKSVSVFVFEM